MTGNNEFNIKYFKEHDGEAEFCYREYFLAKLTYEEFMEIWNRV